MGATRRPDKSWVPFNTPANLRTSIERNLRTLKQGQVQLVHLRLMGPGAVPLAEQLGAMFELQKEGKIQHVGLSNVSPEELAAGLELGEIASVENMYGYAQRTTMRDDHGESPRRRGSPTPVRAAWHPAGAVFLAGARPAESGR
ncbi:MAG: aldo/keto reductase [Hymenobacter sp.]